MKTKWIVMALLLTQSFAHAGNRDSNDSLFSPLPTNTSDEDQALSYASHMLAQTVMLSGDVAGMGISYGLIKGNPYKSEIAASAKSLKVAEGKLKQATDLVTEAEATRWIGAIKENPQNYDASQQLLPKAANEVQRISLTRFVSENEKAVAVEEAKLNVAAARESVLKVGQKAGLMDKSIKILRRGTILFFAFDAASRFYVWNAYDAEPGFFPAGTYIRSLFNK